MSSFPGVFIEPDVTIETVEDPSQALKIPILSGHKAIDHVGYLAGRNPIFDELCGKLSQLKLVYEDQCSAQYYFDLATVLGNLNGDYDRVVEVGVFMGGSSAIFAGLIDKFNFDLDLVDTNSVYLRFTYERIRRLFPEAAARVRLFHGNLASYVKYTKGNWTKSIVHHDGSHEFTQVTKDLASLSFLREKLIAVIAQDTHLRGTKFMNFVDMAIYAVFGTGLSYAPIGMRVVEGDLLTHPDKWVGNYFVAGAPEGMVIPMSANRFYYPHPDLDLDFFL